jgi:hypothetical protein
MEHRQGDVITNYRYMSLVHWNAGKARLDNGSHAMMYECGVSQVHVNMNNIRQIIKPWAAGTFATHPVSLTPCDNQSHIPTTVPALVCITETLACVLSSSCSCLHAPTLVAITILLHSRQEWIS